MSSAGDGPQRTLAALEASGVSSFQISWERLLALNCAVLVEPGSNIVDIGGKKGRHVAFFLNALRSGRVYVFEPNPAMANILRRRFAACRKVAVLEIALSDHAGAEEFIVNLGAPGESGLRQRAYSNPDRARLQRIAVPVARLDDQIFEHPVSFVKIDIEGGEIGVLRGGRDFLARHRPLLSVEYGRPSYSAYGHTADTLYEEAVALGYAVCDLLGNVFESVDAWRACVDRLYWDYLMIPNERLHATIAARATIARRAAAELRRQSRLQRLARGLPFFSRPIERRLKRLG